VFCAWSFRKTEGIPKLKPVIVCVISGLRREVDDNCGLLGYYAASSGNLLPTFRDNLSVPSSGVKSPRPLKMGQIGCPVTSVRNKHYSKKSAVLSFLPPVAMWDVIRIFLARTFSVINSIWRIFSKIPVKSDTRCWWHGPSYPLLETFMFIVENLLLRWCETLSLWNCGFWRASLFSQMTDEWLRRFS